MKTNAAQITRMILIMAILFNNVPVGAAGQTGSILSTDPNQITAAPTPTTYTPPNLPTPELSQQAWKNVEHKPSRELQQALELRISASVIDAGGNVTIGVVVKNNLTTVIEPGDYLDRLEPGLGYVETPGSEVNYDPQKNEVRQPMPNLEAGQEYSFGYRLHVNLKGKKEILVHTAELENNQTAEVVIGGNGAELGLPKTNGGWNDVGNISIHTGKGTLGADTVIAVTPVKKEGKGPQVQFKLELLKLNGSGRDGNGKPREGQLELLGEEKSKFQEPVMVAFDVRGMIDLQRIPAGQEVYVATYDETNQVWVKVPIIELDKTNQRVAVRTPHFSTWGVGLGESLPQNGASVLLYDQPNVSLFQGSARYSFPIWAPPGRNGMTPSVTLNYSSSTVDGVLGDVQAPWVGTGWNIDGMEIVRKITTSDTGYGYANEFALTLNGTIYKLVEDTIHPGRYNTERSSFLMIQRHNRAIGNQGEVENATGEWWEVVSTDGTRYRLGYTTESEQLALMYGYRCTAPSVGPCITPDGPYASSGYAGNAPDLVAMRWRVDRETDTNGNEINYTYTETTPAEGSLTPKFDRASYLTAISYSAKGGDNGYSINFLTAPRNTVPPAYNLWDHFDTNYLSAIAVKKGNYTIRTYGFGYHTEPVPNAHGTLVLESIRLTGGDVEAPTVRFSYENKPNRAVNGSKNQFTYPRLQKIESGYSSMLSFVYENDGRGNDSWYNWRVKETNLSDGVGKLTKRAYGYNAPVYAEGTQGLGELIGYSETTETLLGKDGSKVRDTIHHFGTTGLDRGNEMWTEARDGNGVVLQKTTYDYATDNSQAPFPGWNFHYLYRVQRYENGILQSGNITKRDPGTGNVVVQEDTMGNTIYRRHYYEYRPNFSPAVYILGLPSREIVTDASNVISQDSYYHYDGDLGQPPLQGNLTLAQQVITGNATSDTRMTYDEFGNQSSLTQFLEAGQVGAFPTGDSLTRSITYDTGNAIYPVSVTDAMGHTITTEYDTNLGVPVRVTDANGWETVTTYDGLGRVLTVTPPGLDGAGVEYEYPVPDSNKKILAPYAIRLRVLDTTPSIATYRSSWGIYDGLGRLIQAQVKDDDHGRVQVTNTEYDPALGFAARQGLPVFVNGSGGSLLGDSWDQYVQTETDALGRMIKVTAPGNLVTTTAYNGLSVTTTDPAGKQKTQTFDGLGRITSVEEQGSVVTYRYNVLDQMIQTKDPLGKITTLEYDRMGRKTTMTSADTGTWSYEYDALGRMTKQTDARSQMIGFTYDELGRLIAKVDLNTNTPLVSYSYGNTPGTIGFRIGMDDQSGETSWQYSDYGRSVTEQRTIGTTSLTFAIDKDWLGRTLGITYPNGEEVVYGYNAMGQTERMTRTDDPTMALASLAYNALGQITAETLGNGMTITNTYDAGGTGRLLEREAVRNNTMLMDFSYQYDASGNITQLTDGKLDEVHTYLYDGLNRLISAEAKHGIDPVYREQYQYDKGGNLLQVNEWQQSDVVASLDFEDETLSDWTAVTPDRQNIWTVGAAAITPVSGQNSLVVDIRSNTPNYLVNGLASAAEHYRARFYLDTNTLNMNNSNNMVIFEGTNGTGSVLFQVKLRRLNGIYQAAVVPGLGTAAENDWAGLQRGWNSLEVEWNRTGTGSASLNLWVNNQQAAGKMAAITGDGSVLSTKLGAVSGIQDNTRGQILLDAFEARELAPATAQPQARNNPLAKLFSMARTIFGQAEQTETPTAEPTVTRTLIPTPTDTLVPSATLSATLAPAPTNTKTPAVTNTKTATPTRTPSPTSAPSLIAKWNFDELSDVTTYDEISPKSNGTLQLAERVPGMGIGAIRFSGVGSRVKIGDSAKLKPLYSFTLSAWVFGTGITSGTEYTILNKGGSSMDYRIYLDTEGHIVFHVEDLTPGNVVGPILRTGEWVHIVAVYDQSAKVSRLYINGFQVASELVSGSLAYGNTNALSISDSNLPFDGMIDEVSLYNGALSDAAIASLAGLVGTNTPFPTNTKTTTATMTATKTATPFTKTPTITRTPTITMTIAPSATPTSSPTMPVGNFPWGTGADGNLTVNATETVNLNTFKSAGRSCADAIAYSVSALSSTTATLAETPASGCLAAGDEVILMQMDDPAGNFTNTGTYEFLRIQSIVDDMLLFNTPKVGYYGSAAMSDNGIGTGGSDQKVMLVRVPNYNNVTINGTLTTNAWNGGKYGVLAFRSATLLSGTGLIDMKGKGFAGGSTKAGEGPGGGQQATAKTGIGGGGGYGSTGATSSTSGSGAGGITYGDPALGRLYLGSGGGAGSRWSACTTVNGVTTCESRSGGSGGNGAGIVVLAAKEFSLQGSIQAQGDGPDCADKCNGGVGSGGSIRLEGGTINVANLNANQGDGEGRIALYSLDVIPGNSLPAAYVGVPGQMVTPVPSPSPTAISFPTPDLYGNGSDGDLEVSLGSTLNLSELGTNPGRSCPQGGEMISFAVKELTAGSAKLSQTPQGACLAVGDEVLLIKMNGEGSTAQTTGQHEFLRVGGVEGDTVYFKSAKELYYGTAADNDTGIGIGNHDQHVQIVRVPHYANMIVNGTLSGKAWDGTSGGVMVLRVSGVLSGNGTIEMNGAGYRGTNSCGESISGYDCATGGGQKGESREGRMPKGGGGAHTSDGVTGTKGGDGQGGLAYATPGSDRLYPGSAGGHGGCQSSVVDGPTCGGSGGNGGGVIYILASEVAMTNGTISVLGEGGDTASGSGAGGSIQVEGQNITLGQAMVSGGIRNIAGGNGSSYAIYRGTLTSGVFVSELDLDAPVATPLPTPTPTAVPTLNPASAVWHTRVYNYDGAHPNRVTGTSDMDTYTYDANGNQVTRTVEGVSWTLTYNAENRLASLGDGNGNNESYLYDGDGVRVAIFDSEVLAREFADQHATTYFRTKSLPPALHPVYPKGNAMFDKSQAGQISHGGLSIEELIVPFIEVTRA